MLYACEAWTLNTDLQKRIQAVKMRCIRRLLGISYRDHVTNNKVRRRVTKQRRIQAVEMRCLRRLLDISYNKVPRRVTKQVRHYEDLLTTIKNRKLRWYEHVTRSEGLRTTILKGTVQGKRRRGRQNKRWADSILEWTGKSFAITQAIVHNRTRLSQLAHRTSIMQRPYDPGGLRDQ